MKHTGNAMAEYGFIGTIVLVAAIALLLLGGQNLEKALRGLKGDMGTSISGARDFAKIAAAEKQARAAQSQGIIGLTKICTSGKHGSRVCVSLPQDAALNAVATTGGLGNQLTEEQFLEAVRRTLKQLDWEQRVNIVSLAVKDLANTGYEIGKAERDLQHYCAQGSVCDYGLSNVPTDTELGSMVKDKGNEIKYKSDQFEGKKAALDTMLTVAPNTLSNDEKETIDSKTTEIVQVVANKDAEAMPDVKNGTVATIVEGGSGSICKTVDSNCSH